MLERWHLNSQEIKLLFVNISKKHIVLQIFSTIGNLKTHQPLKMDHPNGLMLQIQPNLDFHLNKMLILKDLNLTMVLFFSIKISIVMMVFSKLMYSLTLLVMLLSWLDTMMRIIFMHLNLIVLVKRKQPQLRRQKVQEKLLKKLMLYSL